MATDERATETERTELLALVGDGLAVDAAALFPETDGFFVRRANRKRAALLGALRPVLERALGDGERIEYAARAVLYSALEYMFSGYAVAQSSNQLALVLTTERVLLVWIDRRGRPRDIKNQVRRSELRGAKVAGIGRYLQLHLADGKKLALVGLAKRDRAVFARRLPLAKGAPKAAQASLEHLCPSCLKAVPGRAGEVLTCPHLECRAEFRSAKRAALMSAFVPGIGDLYLRHFFFGALELVGNVLTLALATYFLLLMALAPTAENIAVGATLGGLFVVAPRLIDYFVTLHMGRKGIVPLAPEAAAAKSARRSLASGGKPAAFPGWVRVLFGISAIGYAASVAAMLPIVRSEAALGQAELLARAGDFDAALALVDEHDDPTPIARVALALYEGGDLLGGDAAVEMIGERQVENGVADKLNAFIARLQHANERYQEGLRQIADGNETAGGVAIDDALAVFNHVKRPEMPQTRGHAAAEALVDVLTPPVRNGDVEVGERFAAMLGEHAGSVPGRIARARLAAARGAPGEARQLLDGVDLAPLAPAWRLIALETRAAVASGADELGQVALAARAIAVDELSDGQQIRRLVLVALGDLDDALASAPVPKLNGAALLAHQVGLEAATRRLMRIIAAVEN